MMKKLIKFALFTFDAKTPQCKQREMIRIARNKNPSVRFYKVEIDESRGVLVRKELKNIDELH